MADEKPKIEEQDTSSPIEELQKRMEDIEMSLGVFNPRNLGGLRTKDLQQATRANLFGDGSDGDVVVSTSINLTRDMFYNNLTVESGGIINTKSFRIFVKDQFIKKPGGILKNNGNNGANGNTTTGGAGGVAVASGSLPGGIAGGDGGRGGNTGSYGEPGDDGTDASKSLGSAGSGGGGGGNGSSGFGYSASAGGDGGSQTGTVFNIINSFFSAYYLIDILPSIVALTISAGSGGGGGGGSSTTHRTSGGGAGSTGGLIWIAANRMFIEGTDEIQCDSGNGGNGVDGNDGNPAEGGGGGGAGGSGGVIILIYGEKTGTGTLSVDKGAGGTGGTGGTGVYEDGHPGSPGTAGTTGKTYNIQIQ